MEGWKERCKLVYKLEKRGQDKKEQMGWCGIDTKHTKGRAADNHTGWVAAVVTGSKSSMELNWMMDCNTGLDQRRETSVICRSSGIFRLHQCPFHVSCLPSFLTGHVLCSLLIRSFPSLVALDTPYSQVRGNCRSTRPRKFVRIVHCGYWYFMKWSGT